jgi:chromatin remodeling complex protein RSC6
MAKKANAALSKKLETSEAFEQLFGVSKCTRAEAIKLFWDYVKDNDLQSKENKRNIILDDELEELFEDELSDVIAARKTKAAKAKKEGKKFDPIPKGEISMFEVATLLNAHLS